MIHLVFHSLIKKHYTASLYTKADFISNVFFSNSNCSPRYCESTIFTFIFVVFCSLPYLSFKLYCYNLTWFLHNVCIFKILSKNFLEDVWCKYLFFFSFTKFLSLFWCEDINICSLDLGRSVFCRLSRNSVNFATFFLGHTHLEYDRWENENISKTCFGQHQLVQRFLPQANIHKYRQKRWCEAGLLRRRYCSIESSIKYLRKNQIYAGMTRAELQIYSKLSTT